MSESPFAFLRGTPFVMARDLAHTPHSGLRSQICGDAHLANFGLFGTPERNLIFDLNDFDETLPGPFEWDVKRLAASFVVAAKQNGPGRPLRQEGRAQGRGVLPADDARVDDPEPAGGLVAPRGREGARRTPTPATPRSSPRRRWRRRAPHQRARGGEAHRGAQRASGTWPTSRPCSSRSAR